MIVLGMDTSGYVNAVGVVSGGSVLADFALEARSDSLEKILANIDDVLKGAGLDMEDVQGFGVGLGPESWTGIRVGVTVGKMLAYATGRPVCGVPTLEALAFGYAGKHKMVCPVISAGTRDAVYAAAYRVEGGAVSRVGEYYVGDIAGLAAEVSAPMVVIGCGAEDYRRRIAQELDSSRGIEAVEATPGGAVVARLAAARLESGDSDDTLALTPLYLKESTARAFQGRQNNIGK